MSLETKPQEPQKKKNVLIIVVVALVVLAILVASVFSYMDRRERKEAQRREEAATELKRSNTEGLQQAQEHADLNRLISICMSAKERYDALPEVQKAKEVAPDCTVHVQ